MINRQHQDERIQRLERLVSQLHSSNGDGTETPKNDIDITSSRTCIAAFRSHMLPQFPFLRLPDRDDHRNAEKLQRDRPFLFRAILCVATPSQTEKQTRIFELQRALCEAAFLRENEGNGSMDLLLAVLTLAAWGWDYHYYISGGISLSRLVMLAVSLVGEMWLGKPAPQRLRSLAGFIPSVVQGLDHGLECTSSTTGGPSLEQTRAVLGCFVLSSVVSDHFGQMDGLRWTRQMEEGLAVLRGSNECKNDALLILQVRLQLLAAKARELDEGQDATERRDSTTGTAATLVTPARVEGLLSQLRNIQNSVAEESPEHFQILQTHISHTELCILETITRRSAGEVAHEHSRAVLPAIRTCLSNLLALLPHSNLIGGNNISFIHWAQLTHCLTSLQELVTNHSLAALVHANDLHPTLFSLGQLADRLEQSAGVDGAEGSVYAEEEANSGSGRDVFRALAVGIRTFLEGFCVGGDEDVGEEGVGLGTGEHRSGGGAAAAAGVGRDQDKDRDGNVEPNLDVVVPQKGYFWNKRFWLDQHLFGETGAFVAYSTSRLQLDLEMRN